MIWLVDAPIHHAKLIRNNMKSDVNRQMIQDPEGNYETLIGNYIDRYVVAEDRERVYMLSSIEHLIRNTKEDEIYHVNFWRTNPDGVRNYIQLSAAKVIDEMGVVRIVFGFRNIDSIIEEEKNRNMLYSMAHIDNMTNVNNRRTFDEYMDSNAKLNVSGDLVFFSFDLNELKKANDTSGHEAGDEIIIGAADCMKAVLGKYGRIYRTGGDEFAAIVTLGDSERAQVIAKLKERFASWRGKLYPHLSVSMGYVCASENPQMTLDDMRKEADKRMYAQKSDYYSLDGNDRRRSRNN
jgi:diguanylate cyclase (GGDEF)-like protein